MEFDEIFSPVVKMTSIRTVLSIAASMNLEVEQLDVKTAFLHGDLEEEIYMQQPEGFVKRVKRFASNGTFGHNRIENVYARNKHKKQK